MVTVSYEHDISYGYDPNGRRYPRLTLRIENPGTADEALDSDAYLDSGAERSVFDGRRRPGARRPDYVLRRRDSASLTTSSAKRRISSRVRGPGLPSPMSLSSISTTGRISRETLVRKHSLTDSS